LPNTITVERRQQRSTQMCTRLESNHRSLTDMSTTLF